MSRPREGAILPLVLKAGRPVFVLVAICLVASVPLALVNALTAPVIADAARERAQATYRSLMPDAARFEEVPCEVEGVTTALRALDATGAPIGYVVVAEAQGYGGELPIAVSFFLDGSVGSIVAMDNEETPGLGKRVAEPDFSDQFVGRPAEEVALADVDTISGATISSKAYVLAFNRAIEAYQEVQG